MDNLIETISEVIDHLSSTVVEPNSVEAQSLTHLSNLLAAIQNSNQIVTDQCGAQLRNLWLSRVPWCSNLSRSLEKILILYDESVANGG